MLQAVLNQEASMDKVSGIYCLQVAAIFVLIHNAFICMKGAGARMSAFVGAFAIADLVKSTLGPKGMDKILCPMVSFVSYRLVLKSAVICV